MATILSKYSKAQDLTFQGITNDSRGDVNTPYSFTEWIARNTGVIPGKEKKQYDDYLASWYDVNKNVPIVNADRIKEDYINLVKQISLIFQNEAEASWAVDINFDDPLEVEQVIPFYARKLKEIAIYLINKREAIKKAKLKYNLAGNREAIENLFYEYLLKAFTKRKLVANEYLTNVTDVSVLNILPELSAVSQTFQIQIEELYDDTSYFDHDPQMPITTYYDLSATAVTSYLTGIGFQPTDFEWLYSTGSAYLCADNPLLWSLQDVLGQYTNGIPTSALESPTSTILNEYNKFNLTKKYLGESQYIVSGGYYQLWEANLSLPLQIGNNWFYWPIGEVLYENDTTRNLDPIYLINTDLIKSGATSSDTYLNSDIIFTQRGNIYKGAWLQNNNIKTSTPIMSARLQKGTYAFSFPFPGYGVSGEDLEWTGKKLDNVDYEFNYLEPAVQNDIIKQYWSTTLDPVSSITPIYIYNTNLIECGSTPGTKYDNADVIIVRSVGGFDINPNGIYNGNQSYAWLSKMFKTDIPIAVGTTNIYWPFTRYNNQVSVVALSSQCAQMYLKNINMRYFVGAQAGTTPKISDVIYKLSSPNGTTTEAAWLSGRSLTTPANITNATLISGVSQPGLTFVARGGLSATFIWDQTNTAADNVFKHYNHQSDCLYLKNDLISLYNERPTQKKTLNYNQWADCNCKALFYSPLGHPGTQYDEYDRMGDFIASVTNPFSAFDFTTWRGTDGLDYLRSSDFGWFRLTGTNLEPDVGWGNGSWVTNTGLSFTLKQNTLYTYYRNGLNRDKAQDNAAYFVVKYPYISQKQEWIQMVFDTITNQWISTNETSPMIIKPGDYLSYKHQNVNAISFSAVQLKVDTQEITLPNIEMFNNLTFIGSLCTYTDPSTYTTLPISIAGINEEIIYPSMTNGIPTTGMLHMDNFNNLINISTVLSTVSSFTPIINTVISDNINFVWNVPLSGWDYNNKRFDNVSPGARPYWAKAIDSNTADTKYKGIAIWGGNPILVDSYNFITQPEFSDIVFTSDLYLEYKNTGSSTIIWQQPIKVTTNIPTQNWCSLLFDTSGVSNLSGILDNTINELIVTATNVSSDIVFDIVENEPLLINYYARGDFTWNQRVIDSSIGIPPTGGVWSPIITGELVTPLTPAAYLTNRHYPTYATAPYVGNLYSVDDVGGYFIPKMLGVSTAIGKKYQNIVNTYDTINKVESQRGLTCVYRDLNLFAADNGLTNTIQLVPVSTVNVDNTWMKAALTEWYKSGMIVGARDHQKFMPYQSKYETIKTNDNGVRRQGDKYDPWTGDEDSTWENETDFPTNFRKQYTIEKWYNQFFTKNMQLYQWKTDIFGNQYALFKDIRGKSIYEQRQALGEIWTRDARNIIKPATESLGEVYNTFIALESTLTLDLSTKVQEMSLWYDTLMIQTTGYALFAKLDFDYDENLIYALADNTHRIALCDGYLAGTWFFEEPKVVTICTLMPSDIVSTYYPVFYKYDLETNELKVEFTGNNSSIINSMSSLSLSSIEDPIFTYNKDQQRYNISFIGNSNIRNGMYLISMSVSNYGNVYDIDSVIGIIPTN